MLMTRKQACDILNVSEGATKEEIKQEYAKIALTIHPDQKTSTPFTTEQFQRVSLAYKRLHQSGSRDWVEQSHLMEQFSTVFRFRMKTENGYVYFMYNPFTGLPDSDSDDDFDFDDDDFDLLTANQRMIKKAKAMRRQNKPKKIVDVDPVKFKQMKESAEKNALELIDEEDKEKIKARKRREKKLRQKEKKKLLKDDCEVVVNDKSLKNKTKQGGSVINMKETEKKTFNNGLKKASQPNYEVNSETIHQSTKMKGKREKKILMQPGVAQSNGYDSDDSNSDGPEWDENSAFVSKALKNVKQVDGIKTGRKKAPSNPGNETNLPVSQPNKSHDVIALSRQLAMQANQLASNGDYNEAAKLFTQAISLFSKDCRYYGNRSFCYDRMGQYNNALEDANVAINLSSFWAKGYFRKGRALAGLGRYIDAEQAYEEVLKLDQQCFDAEHELHAVRIKHLMDMGFSKQHCEIALKKKKTITLALDELLSGGLANIQLEDVYVSDPEEEQFYESPNKKVEASSSPPSSSSNEDTFSEVDYNSLWIGNITARVTEQKLFDYFSQFGIITGISAMFERRCAFVNFQSNEDCKKALLASDTVTLAGESLVIRYPDRAYNQAASRLNYKSKRECFYWRNRGCHFGSACRYLHVEANKGIDLQTLERTPYQSIVKY